MELKDRLNKYLALHLGISRRQADDLIAANKVTIDGKIAKLGARIDSNTKVNVSSQEIKPSAQLEYIAFHKPAGYVCSRKQQGDVPTIYQLLPAKYHNLKPVGRLDKDSSGLILLTNDGNFAQKMTHPSFGKVKIYEVELNRELEPLHQQMISDHGVDIGDGPSKLQLERLSDTNRKTWKVTMHEGRNRQIRRTFQALGYEVTKLHRTNFGPYSIGNLEPKELMLVKIA